MKTKPPNSDMQLTEYVIAFGPRDDMDRSSVSCLLLTDPQAEVYNMLLRCLWDAMLDELEGITALHLPTQDTESQIRLLGRLVIGFNKSAAAWPVAMREAATFIDTTT